MVITETQRNEIMYLVVGMFNGAPGATFLSEFTNAVSAGQSIAVDLAAGLAGTSQFKAIYPDFQTATEFATAFADNILGNTVTAALKTEAIDDIVTALNAGSTKAQVMSTAITALGAVDPSNADWGAARTALDNKVDVATWFSVEKAVETESVSELQAILSTVTEDPATATAAKDDKNLPGTSDSFTSNVDTLVGGNGSDQFSGVINTVGGTIQVGDSLDGGDSYDTLSVVAVTGGLDTALVNVTNVEEVVISDSATATIDHNLASITGLAVLNLNTLSQATTVEGVSTSVDFTVTGQTTAGNLVINYSDAADTGDQTAKLLLKNSQGGHLTAAGIEIVEITTEGSTDATSDLTFVDAGSITIKGTTNITGTVSTGEADSTLVLEGAGKVVLGALDTDISTVTATANSGGVELILNSDKDVQVALGTGADTITTSTSYAAIATDTALIDGGSDAATDTLKVMDSTHLSTAGHFTGFETLQLENAVSVDMDNIAGITALVINDGAGSTGATDMSAAVAGNITLGGAAGTLVLGVKDSTTLNQIDTVKITVDDGDTDLKESLTTVTTLTMVGVEILDVVAVDNANITLSETANDGLNSVLLSGAGDIAIVTGDLSSASVSINGSTATGDLTINASAFAGTTLAITAGSGTNTITGSSIVDTIVGGTGNNTVTGGAGIDIITLGTGVDTVVVAAASVLNYDQITGFNAGGTATDDNILAADATFSWFGDGAADNDGVVALSTGATIKAAEAADDDATILTISTDAAANTFDLFMAGSDNEAAFEAKIITALGLTGAASTTDILLIAIDDGEHTGLFEFTGGDAATDDAVDASEIELIGILNGVTDATTLVAGDFLFA